MRGEDLIKAFKVNKLHVTGFFLYPLKTSKNHWFSGAFKGYGKRPVT